MSRHQYADLRTIVGRLSPSTASPPGAAAVYGPGLLLQLQAIQREQAVTAPSRSRSDGSPAERCGSNPETAPRSPA